MVASESTITVDGVSTSAIGTLITVIGTPVLMWEDVLSAFVLALDSQLLFFPTLDDVVTPVSLFFNGQRFLIFFGCSVILLATFSLFVCAFKCPRLFLLPLFHLLPMSSVCLLFSSLGEFKKHRDCVLIMGLSSGIIPG